MRLYIPTCIDHTYMYILTYIQNTGNYTMHIYACVIVSHLSSIFRLACLHTYRWETASSLTCTISWSSIAFELSRSTTQSSRNYCPPSYYQQQYVNFYTYINTSYIHTCIHTSSNIQNIVRTCVHTVRSTTYYTYYIHICITYVHTYILCWVTSWNIHIMFPVNCLPQGSVGFTTDKALSSSCFHALVSSFVPLMLLDSPAYSLAVGKVHSWLRLLVSYHAPALVQHLDRWQLCMHVCMYFHCYACMHFYYACSSFFTLCMNECMYAYMYLNVCVCMYVCILFDNRVLPGWEQPARDLTSTQAEKVVKTIKSGIDLDELERELGIISYIARIPLKEYTYIHTYISISISWSSVKMLAFRRIGERPGQVFELLEESERYLETLFRCTMPYTHIHTYIHTYIIYIIQHSRVWRFDNRICPGRNNSKP